MSANDDRGQEDTVDLKDLEKMISKFAESVEKLTEKLGKNTKAFDANKDLVAEHSEQTKKNKLEVQDAYFQNLKVMAEFRKELKDSGGQFNFLTGLLKNGTSAVGVIAAITKKLDGMGSSFDELKRATKEVADFEDIIKQRMKDQNRTGKPEDNKDLLTDAERKQMGRAESSKDENKGADSKTNQFMSFGKDFFKKHAAGIAIGAAGAGTILKVLKMAFDASPMFQQIQKLLKFGIMMVLRPIGDFFGFLFRPIMILLLRKFIIPWYTKMYPQMMKWGTEIGTKLAGALGALADGDIGKAFAVLWGDVDWGKVIWDTVRLMSPAIAATDFIAGLFGVGDNTWTNEWGRKVGEWFTTGLEEATVEWNKFWTSTYTWFSTGIDTIIAPFSDIWGGLFSWFTDGITTLTKASSWSDFWDKILTWFQLGLDGYVLQFGDLWDKIVTWLKDILPFGLGNVLFPDDGSTEDTIKDTVETGAGAVGGVATGVTSFFKDPLGSLTNAWDDFFGGGGNTNNNQEINININATGGSNGELAQTIKTEVAAAVQEIQTQGSPR